MDEVTIKQYVRGARGFFFGYIEGLYSVKDAQLPEMCLNNEISERITSLISQSAQLSFGGVFAIIGHSAAIIANLD